MNIKIESSNFTQNDTLAYAYHTIEMNMANSRYSSYAYPHPHTRARFRAHSFAHKVLLRFNVFEAFVVQRTRRSPLTAHHTSPPSRERNRIISQYFVLCLFTD